MEFNCVLFLIDLREFKLNTILFIGFNCFRLLDRLFLNEGFFLGLWLEQNGSFVFFWRMNK